MRALAPWLALSLGLWFGVACASMSERRVAALFDDGAARPERVLLVSVAGLRSAHLEPDGRMPLLEALARRGVRADAVEAVGAPLVYPVHATLVTGRAPDLHGVVADRLLGRRGVRNAPFWHATRVQGASLWQTLHAGGQTVAAIGWPSTVGAAIDLLVPDLAPVRSGETWLGVLEGSATPELVAAMRRELSSPDAVWPTADERDRALVAAACTALGSPTAPRLVLLRLGALGEAIEAAGSDAPDLDAALRRTDTQLGQLLGCLGSNAAIAVVGDRALEPVHTRVDPNVALARAGLLVANPGTNAGVASWSAIARATDSLATVHAVSEAAALEARRLLDGLAVRSGAFRVVGAAELQERRGDPQAWFGLEAAPGYVFGDGVEAPLLRPAVRRAAGRADAGQGGLFVAAGNGVRAGVRVPGMTQLDVGPTLAQLLGVKLEDAEGRVLVGALAGAAASPPAVGSEGRAEP